MGESELEIRFNAWWTMYCNKSASPVIDTPMNRETAWAAYSASHDKTIDLVLKEIESLD